MKYLLFVIMLLPFASNAQLERRVSELEVKQQVAGNYLVTAARTQNVGLALQVVGVAGSLLGAYMISQNNQKGTVVAYMGGSFLIGGTITMSLSHGWIKNAGKQFQSRY